jgi:hypothetical protein
MALSKLQKEKIAALLERKIEDKLRCYARETSSIPFLTRLIQDSEKVAAYSFIHSIATTLGMSIYEDVSKSSQKKQPTNVLQNMMSAALYRVNKNQ